MKVSWDSITARMDRWFPRESPRRKLLELVAIILLFEGISVLILFSYQGAPAGIFSLALGILLLLILHPGTHREVKPSSQKGPAAEPGAPREDPPGIKLVDATVKWIDNDYVIMAAGAAIIILVIVWNQFFSARPEWGDLDTLSVIFGGLILVFPLLLDKFKVEASFSIFFLGLVVVFLVVPQAVTSLHEGAGSSVGNWYVHYMLAEPFSRILDLIGIPSSSVGSMVTIQFRDGTTQALSISAYCAGLYSFSIFLSAFLSFVLVFERIKTRLLVAVLALGILIAFLGNLFRMVIIGVVGYYRGLDALLWTHSNAGWIIFLSWSAVFWYFLLGYVSRQSAATSSSK